MTAKNPDCNGCFYEEVDPREGPCNSCFATAKYVHKDVFKDVSDSPVFKQTGKLSWEYNPADSLRETFGKEKYDNVDKPRHYMLFEEEGIEVRDVIKKLAEKVNKALEDKVPDYWGYPLFVTDYVQMLQYVMRFMDKNGVEDLKKARWYLDKMIMAYNAGEAYE